MSPRTTKQYEEIREEKRTLIMDTALEHFANEGYYATTINHIAKYAGISKGLMYNYFESKEALLRAIIHKSVSEVYSYFDIDRDGYLSEDEFEFFVRKVNIMLKEKRSFWRLFFQLLMQNDVREQFLKSFVGSDSLVHSGTAPGVNLPASQIMKMISDYFIRKKEIMDKNYDPLVEVNMFIIALKGFAITRIYTDENEDADNEKTINRIIELFK
jgi:AcrR family transcriptional regulator